MLEATPDGLDTGKPLALKGFLLTIKLSQEQRLTFGQRGYAELIKCPPVPKKTFGYLVHLDGMRGHKLGSIDLAICPSHLDHFPFSRRTQLETVLTLREE